MPIKQQLTPDRANKVFFSLQKQGILAKVIEIENACYMDTDFKIPYINNFLKRIGSDCKVVKDHIAKSGRIAIKNENSDFVEEYAAEIWRVMDMLIGLDASAIKEFADNLEKELKAIGL